MKFEKLTDTKIRIILSIKDIESNNLSIDNVLSNSKDSQNFLDTLITKAEQELDFKTEDSQLLVEAISSCRDEYIFTITKLLEDKIYCCKNNNYFIFKFDCFDDFVNLCTFLKNFSYLCLKEISKNFSLIFYNNNYYLKFVDAEYSSIVIDYIKCLFEEFAKDVSHSNGIDGVLNEYGKIVFSKNAIMKCINSFSL